MRDLRGVLPDQRPPVDAAILDEPTSEVPVIRPGHLPATPTAGAEVNDPADAETAAETEAVTEPGSLDSADAVDSADSDDSVDSADTSDADFDRANTAPTAGAAPDGLETHNPETELAVHNSFAFPNTGEPAPVVPAATPPVVARFGTQPEAAGQPVSRAPGDVVETAIALWSDDESEALREQWRELQVQFIDDPAAAVTGARELVTEAVQQLADTLLAAQSEFDPYRNGESVDTEAMRVAMRRYREFLDRVLAL